MNAAIEERIVQMKFDNSQFESGVKRTLESLANLKSQLHFDNINTNINLSGISDSVSAITDKFSALGIMGVTALQNIANKAVDTGEQLIKSLTIDQLTAGWGKYDEKTKSVQTIMNATGESIDVVNEKLDKLNWFSDETSYSFTDMTSSIGKFTSAGVSLDDAVTAMEGISNLAALSGQGAAEASRAMYNFSQAIGTGSLKLQDWKSIQNANMATLEFKETLIEAGLEMGTIIKVGDQFQSTTTDNKGDISDLFDAVQGFDGSLSSNWINNDVMMAAFKKYGAYADAVYEISDSYDTCAEAMKHVSDEGMELGARAFKAAQEAKTFADAIEATKDAVSSGWMNTFEIIFGNYEEAKVLWTDLANALWDAFASGGEARNELLQGWKDLGGRDALINSFWNAWNRVAEVMESVKEAFQNVFPPATAGQIFSFTRNVEQLSEKFLYGETIVDQYADAINQMVAPSGYTAIELIAQGIKNVWLGVVKVVGLAKEAFSEVFGEIRISVAPVANFLRYFRELTYNFRTSEEVADNLKRIFKGVFSVFDIGVNAVKSIGTVISKLSGYILPASDGFLGAAATVGDYLVALDEAIKNNNIFGIAVEKICGFLDIFKSVASNTITNVISAFNTLKDVSTRVLDGLNAKFEARKESLSKFGEFFMGVFTGISDAFKMAAPTIEKIGQAFRTLGEKLMPVFVQLGTSIGSAFGSIFTKLLNSVDGANFNGIIDLINGGLSGGIIVAITQFINQTTNLERQFGAGLGIFKRIKGVLSETRDTLETWQNSLRVDILQKLAISIGILAASLVALSLIDSDKLGVALSGVTILLYETIEAMKSFNTIGGTSGFASLSKMSGALIGMSTAILILSFAVAKLSDIGIEGMVVGLGSLELIFVELTAFLNNANLSGMSIGAGLGLVFMATAMNIFASAVSNMGALPIDQIGKGLFGIGVAMTAVGTFMNNVNTAKMTSTAFGMVLLGAALVIFGEAFKNIGALPIDQIGKGLFGMATALVAVGTFMNVVQTEKMISTGIGMIAIATAMVIFGSAITNIGSVPIDQIGKGLFGMATALVAVGTFLNVVNPAKMISTGIGMIAIATAMVIMSSAVGSFGQMSLPEIGKGLLALAGSLAAIVVAANLATGALAGAAAITIMSGAIAMLVPSIILLGSMSVGQVVTGLLTLVGIFAIMGAAAYLLTPLTPVIVALSGALLMLGGGIALVGVGITLIGTGVMAFASALATLAVSGLAGVMALVEAINILIPEICKVIGDSAPAIVDALGKLLGALIVFIDENAVLLIQAARNILMALIVALNDVVPELLDFVSNVLLKLVYVITEDVPILVDCGMKLLNGIVRGIADNIQELIEAGIDCVLNFLNGIESKLPDIIQEGYDLSISFINGIADSIDNNTVPIVNAMDNLGRAILEGLVNGLKAHNQNVLDTILGIGDSMIEDFKDLFGIHSPSRVFADIGENVGQGFVNGLVTMMPASEAVTKEFGGKTISAMSQSLDNIASISDEEIVMSPTIRPVMDLGEVQNGASETKDIMNELQESTKNLEVSTGKSATFNEQTEKMSETLLEKIKRMTDIKLKAKNLNLSDEDADKLYNRILKKVEEKQKQKDDNKTDKTEVKNEQDNTSTTNIGTKKLGTINGNANTLKPSYTTTEAQTASESMATTKNFTQSIDELGTTLNTSDYNSKVLTALDELKKRVDTMSDTIDGMQVVMDTGALVGQISSGINTEIGETAAMERRGG